MNLLKKIKSSSLKLLTSLSRLKKYKKLPLGSDIQSANYSKGYLYIAFGRSFLDEALLSVESLKQFSSFPVHLITDVSYAPSVHDHFTSFEVVSFAHARSKVDYISESPYEKTIYLDTDIIVDQPVDDLFNILDLYDVFATLDVARKRNNISDKIQSYADIPYYFGEINGGLLGFNGHAKITALPEWRKLYYKYRVDTSGWDQPSLRMALWHTKMKLFTLPPEYNVRSKDLLCKIDNSKQILGPLHMKPIIYHIHCDKSIHDGSYGIKNLKSLLDLAKEKAFKVIY